MLKLVHSIESVRDVTTLTYRGYVLELCAQAPGGKSACIRKGATFPSFPELTSWPATRQRN